MLAILLLPRSVFKLELMVPAWEDVGPNGVEILMLTITEPVERLIITMFWIVVWAAVASWLRKLK